MNKKLVEVALKKVPADLVLKNGYVFAGFSGAFQEADVAICGKTVAAIGKDYRGKEEIDCRGKFVLPGFIDAHVHVESSMLSPEEFAAAVVPSGTTAVVADPHEIGNVAGVDGVRYMIDASEGLPLDIYYMLPSCVPSTPLEDAGAVLTAAELRQFLDNPKVRGLAEVMDVPSVLSCAPAMVDKLDMIDDNHVNDGHAPGLMGEGLAAYAAAGIASDHECINSEEAAARLAMGMHLLIREGSAAKNLAQLLPAVNRNTAPYCAFCTDDCHPADLIARGSINYIVHRATKLGRPWEEAILMGSLNAARYFGLKHQGAIAPGYQADMQILDSKDDYWPEIVIKNGQIVARNHELVTILAPKRVNVPQHITNSVNMKPVTLEDFRLPLKGNKANIIGLIPPHQIVTKRLYDRVLVKDGCAVSDPSRDVLKLAVFERHHATGLRGLGLVKGYGLKEGAIASTVGHDSHNLIVVGTNDEDMLLAVQQLQQVQGGEVIVSQGQVLGCMPLSIAGLMTSLPAQEAADKIAAMEEIAYGLGVSHDFDPFLTLAFLSLPVIPDLKITDRGLVDVNQFRVIGIDEEK